MDFSFGPGEDRLRAELLVFLASDQPAGWSAPAWPPPDDVDELMRFNRAVQKLFDAGDAGLSWPEEYGGRGARLIEQIVLLEGTARAKSPLPIDPAGRKEAGPVLIRYGTDEPKPVAAGSSEVHRNILADRVLGLAR